MFFFQRSDWDFWAGEARRRQEMGDSSTTSNIESDSESGTSDDNQMESTDSASLTEGTEVP